MGGRKEGRKEGWMNERKEGMKKDGWMEGSKQDEWMDGRKEAR